MHPGRMLWGAWSEKMHRGDFPDPISLGSLLQATDGMTRTHKTEVSKSDGDRAGTIYPPRGTLVAVAGK